MCGFHKGFEKGSTIEAYINLDPKLKIVTHLPLRELWRADGPATGTRVTFLTKDDIAGLLRAGRVEFVVADVGHPFRWIPLSECYDFWKDEVKPRVALADQRVVLDEFPGGYCYFASEWEGELGAEPIVVLEKLH